LTVTASPKKGISMTSKLSYPADGVGLSGFEYCEDFE